MTSSQVLSRLDLSVKAHLTVVVIVQITAEIAVTTALVAASIAVIDQRVPIMAPFSLPVKKL